jgi:site-specific recombinase XerD
LGKLLTERMVPIAEETVEIIDRIVNCRSAGRPLHHPRTGQLAEFLLTHQGRRVSAATLRAELHRAAAEAGLEGVVPHQLRHTYATALEMSRIASDASFGKIRELALPATSSFRLNQGWLTDAPPHAS